MNHPTIPSTGCPADAAALSAQGFRAFATERDAASKQGGPRGAIDAAFAVPQTIGGITLPPAISIGALIVLTDIESAVATGQGEVSLTEIMLAVYCVFDPQNARHLFKTHGREALVTTAVEWSCDIPLRAMPEMQAWLEGQLSSVSDANPSVPPEAAAAAPADTTTPAPQAGS